jgi:hypothetical protein
MGVTLYEALTGVHPTDRRPPGEGVTPRPARELVSACPPALQELLAAMMAADPADRPESAAACRARLEGLGEESLPGELLRTAPWVHPDALQTGKSTPAMPGTAPAAPGPARTPAAEALSGPALEPGTGPASRGPGGALLGLVAAVALAGLLWSRGGSSPRDVVPLVLQPENDGLVIRARTSAPALTLAVQDPSGGEATRFPSTPDGDGLRFALPPYAPGRSLEVRLLGPDAQPISASTLRVPPRLEVLGWEPSGEGGRLHLRSTPPARVVGPDGAAVEVGAGGVVTLAGSGELRVEFATGERARLRTAVPALPTPKEVGLGLALRRDEQELRVRQAGAPEIDLATLARQELAAVAVFDSSEGMPDLEWSLLRALRDVPTVQVVVGLPYGRDADEAWFEAIERALPRGRGTFVWPALWNLRMGRAGLGEHLGGLFDERGLPFPEHMTTWVEAFRDRRVLADLRTLVFVAYPLPGRLVPKVPKESLDPRVHGTLVNRDVMVPYTETSSVWDNTDRSRSQVMEQLGPLPEVDMVWSWMMRSAVAMPIDPINATREPDVPSRHLIQARWRYPGSTYMADLLRMRDPQSGELSQTWWRLRRAARLLAGATPTDAQEVVEGLDAHESVSTLGFRRGEQQMLAMSAFGTPRKVRFRTRRAGHLVHDLPVEEGGAPPRAVSADELVELEVGLMPAFFVEAAPLDLVPVDGDVVEVRRGEP